MNDKVIIVAGDDMTSFNIYNALREKGKKAVRVFYNKKNKKYSFAKLSISEIPRIISCIKEEHGDIAGFIHIEESKNNFNNIQDTFNKKNEEISKIVYFFAKYLKDDLNKSMENEKTFFITVTRMDGELGISKKKLFSIYQSGYMGLIKSLSLEWPRVMCKAIDFDDSITNHEICNYLQQEVFEDEYTHKEVGYSKGKRFTLQFVEESIRGSSQKAIPDQDSVFLVTGGGRGITAKCIVGHAEKYKSKYILLGRTDLNKQYEWETDFLNIDELKNSIIEYLKSKNEKITPVKINSLINTVKAKIEINDNICKIREAGGDVIYLPVDILDELKLREAIKEVETTFGSIDGFIHGAGMLADKRIENKEEHEFNNVFNTKSTGIKTILKIVDLEKLKYVVLFSSISACFGNIGQTDYSFSNEILNKFAYMFSFKYPKCDVVSIDWGPWDYGMVNETVKQRFEEQGVKIIPINVGVDYMVNEFNEEHNGNNQVMINGDLSMPISFDKIEDRGKE